MVDASHGLEEEKGVHLNPQIGKITSLSNNKSIEEPKQLSMTRGISKNRQTEG